MFWVGEDCFNMVSDFTIAVWCCYVSNMVARPDLESKGAQKVLHYLISNPDLMVRSWRARLYQFGSGTFFKDCGEELRLWLEHPDSDQKLEVRETYHAKRMDLLRRLNNEDGLYGVLGDLIYSFIDLKKTSFPFDLRSKQDFLAVPVWKRALIHISALRVVLNKPANRQWRKYAVNDYKWNIRTFQRYVSNDLEIMSSSPLFNKLPELPNKQSGTSSTPTRVNRKRKTTFTPTPGSEQSPPKTHFVVSLLTSSEDDTESDQDD